MFKQLLSLLFLTILLASCEFLEATDNGGNRKDNANSRNDRQKDDPPFTAEDMPRFINSQMFRAQGTRVYKHSEVTILFQNNDETPLPNTLHPIPLKTQDMDADTSRPNDRPTSCGIDLPGPDITIKARINDCKEKNSENIKAHYWNGKNNGLSGEGDWRLVAHKGGKSIWLDVSTGLLWSPATVARPWNYASGAEVAETDQICNGANDSANDGTDFFLGITPDEVAWRLPTRNDYLQADINGSRFVLSITPDTNVYWTANYIRESQHAWAIQHSTGILSKVAEATSLNIRCVGDVLK